VGTPPAQRSFSSQVCCVRPDTHAHIDEWRIDGVEPSQDDPLCLQIRYTASHDTKANDESRIPSWGAARSGNRDRS